jgi:hypothetical protein
MKTWKKILSLALIVVAFFSVFEWTTYISNISYRQGIDDGIKMTEAFVFQRYGLQVNATDYGNGSYTFLASYANGTQLVMGLSLHLRVQQYRHGQLIAESYHAETLTTFGLWWMANNTAHSGGAYNAYYATYLANSNDSSAFSASWTTIPNEITASNGLQRANGTYAKTTTAGQWTVSNTFSCTANGVSTKLYGTDLESYASGQNTLIAAEQQGVPNQKNMNSGDTLAETLTGTITQ